VFRGGEAAAEQVESVCVSSSPEISDEVEGDFRTGVETLKRVRDGVVQETMGDITLSAMLLLFAFATAIVLSLEPASTRMISTLFLSIVVDSRFRMHAPIKRSSFLVTMTIETLARSSVSLRFDADGFWVALLASHAHAET